MNNYTNDMWNLHNFCKGMLHMYLHWASKETYHFRVTLTKMQSIKMTRNSAQISYSTSKKTVCLCQKGIKCSEIARGKFSKITETARPPGTELDTDKNQYGSYITYHWNWMNSYWMFWIVEVLSEQFLCFKKKNLLQFLIFLRFDKSNPLIFEMCFIRSTIAYQCPNIYNFDVDFSERVLTLSIYIDMYAAVRRLKPGYSWCNLTRF